MKTRLVLTSLVLAALPGLANAQACTKTSVGITPLMDLGTKKYKNFEGGLYPGGKNTPPTAHAAAGLAAAKAIQPLDKNGKADKNGRIVVLSLGMSNTTQEYSAWVKMSDADPKRNPSVVVVDGAQGGQDAVKISDPKAAFWTNIDKRLSSKGVTAQQVQVLWLKEAKARPTKSFPTHARELQGNLEAIVQIAKSRYPNAKICYLSSRIYAGYATTSLNPEPFAYESGFSVKWLITAQINGDKDLNFDPKKGTVKAPWLAWGPYLWADGTKGRSDGLKWVCSDFAKDGTHPATTGRQKVANMLNAHFTKDATSTPWYLGGDGKPRAAVVYYGRPCRGSTTPVARHNGLPKIGNSAFKIGVAQGRPNSAALVLVALKPKETKLATNCSLLVDSGLLWLILPTTTQSNGNRVLATPVPNIPSLAGSEGFVQWMILDPKGTKAFNLPGIALTQGQQIRLGN